MTDATETLSLAVASSHGDGIYIDGVPSAPADGTGTTTPREAKAARSCMCAAGVWADEAWPTPLYNILLGVTAFTAGVGLHQSAEATVEGPRAPLALPPTRLATGRPGW